MRGYRGTSLIINTPLLGPYSRTIPRVLWWSCGGGAVPHERGTPVIVTHRWFVTTWPSVGWVEQGVQSDEKGAECVEKGTRSIEKGAQCVEKGAQFVGKGASSAEKGTQSDGKGSGDKSYVGIAGVTLHSHVH